MADKLNKVQLNARAQRVKMLHDIARAWEGTNKDYAAQRRAEARMMTDDPDFADMEKRADRYEKLANTVTAETEAKRDRQSARAKKRRPRRWHKAADPILDELRGKHQDWRRSDLRHALEKRFEGLGAEWLEGTGIELPGADAIEDYIKSREEDGSLARQVK